MKNQVLKTKKISSKACKNRTRASEYRSVILEDIIGRVFTSVKLLRSLDDIIEFRTEDEVYHMLHQQDCCESVSISDITGDLSFLVGHPILLAREDKSPSGEKEPSRTWTFYNFATILGHVTISWYGESNGYYSEEASFLLVGKKPWEE